MNISLRQIEVFLVTANSGSVSRAAEKLFISQAAASMALKEFETQLGEKLFDRVGKKLILNESGRAAVSMASEIVGRTSELTNYFIDKNNLFGNLIVGASSTIGNYILPEYVADFIYLNSETKVQLEVGNTEEIIKKVVRFEVDAGFIEGSCYVPEIEVVSWMDDELAVFSSVQHDLAVNGDVSIADLEASDWILREKGSGTREIFENQINLLSMSIRVSLELGHTEAIKNAVSRGNGISCLSQYALHDLQSLRVIKIIDTPFLDLRRKFYLIMHKSKYKTKILQSFLEYLGSAGNNLLLSSGKSDTKANQN
jgi:DNA-binding transcriptional LysR family regulator